MRGRLSHSHHQPTRHMLSWGPWAASRASGCVSEKRSCTLPGMSPPLPPHSGSSPSVQCLLLHQYAHPSSSRMAPRPLTRDLAAPALLSLPAPCPHVLSSPLTWLGFLRPTLLAPLQNISTFAFPVLQPTCLARPLCAPCLVHVRTGTASHGERENSLNHIHWIGFTRVTTSLRWAANTTG